ncbi:MAG: GDYXXLXY domain-containing protein [Saprospiraceae bacterium]
MNYFRPATFAIVMLLYLWYPYSMIRGQEKILDNGTSYKFKPRPVDPVDAFRGRYIILNYDIFTLNRISEDSFNCNYGDEVYAILAEDSEGFAYLSDISLNLPDGKDYLILSCNNIWEDKINLKAPENMRKYFLNESIAPEAERIYNQLLRGRSSSDSVYVYVDTKVYNGSVLLEQVYFKDQKVEDYIRSLKK